MQSGGRSDPNKIYDNITGKEYRNGALLCSAHSGIVQDIKEIKEILKDVQDYIILRKKVFQLIFDNKFISGLLTGIIVGVIILIIDYCTILRKF